LSVVSVFNRQPTTILTPGTSIAQVFAIDGVENCRMSRYFSAPRADGAAIPETELMATNWRWAVHRLFPIFVTLVAMAGCPHMLCLAQDGQKPQILKIGSSGSSGLSTSGVNKKDAIQTLEEFIKAETGFENKIVEEKSWSEIADKLSRGELQLGDFQGFEFAWAKKKYPELTPITLAVNGQKQYITVYVMVKAGGPVAKFDDLQGKAVSVPKIGEATLRLYVDHLCKKTGKTADAFFSKIASPNSVEDSLDDVVDAIMPSDVQAAVVSEFNLRAYKARKPGRFAKLAPLAKSVPLPPPVIAYYKGKLDSATLEQVEKGLLHANETDRGRKMLELFKITALEKPPDGFDQVLGATLKMYPLPENSSSNTRAER
jgi:ABC-type phosphate/phosphonate transport system substrate-binding protein